MSKFEFDDIDSYWDSDEHSDNVNDNYRESTYIRSGLYNKNINGKNFKTCKYCGKEGLVWNQKDFDKTGKWQLFDGTKPHDCPKFKKKVEPLIAQNDSRPKRQYKLKNRKYKK